MDTVICVSRETELDRMSAFLDRTIDGQGRLCFVTGEPGAGKSTLLNEFIHRAGQRKEDIQFALGDCNPQTGTVDAYLPFREILTGLTTGETRETAAKPRTTSFLSSAGKVLTEHGPDLIDLFVPGGAIVTRVSAQAAGKIRERRKSEKPGHTNDSQSQASGLEQSHIFEQYTNVVRNLAACRPLVLLIDDLHWADEASISLLFHLSRRLEDCPVMMIGAYRANEVSAGRAGDRHPLETWLNELKRYHGDIWIDLALAQESGGQQFIDELLDTEKNRFTDQFRQELFRLTGGHALYAVELVHYMKDKGYAEKDAEGYWCEGKDMDWEGLPARVEGVISERTSRLDEEEKVLLSAASVLGESFHAEVLACLLDATGRELVRSLSGPLSKKHELVRAMGIDRKAGQRLSNYEFRHNLIHRYFYESLDPVERAMLHEDAAIALESVFAGQTASVAVQLARHYVAAELDEKAIEFLYLAGLDAKRGFAHKEARSHFRTALEILERINAEPGGRGTQFEDLQRKIQIALADVLLLDGEYSGARDLFTLTLENIAGHDPILSSRLLSRIARTHEREHHHDLALEALDQAATYLGDSTERTDADEISEWITIRTARLWLYYWTGDLDGMSRVIEEAHDIVDEFGDATQKRQFYTGLAGFGNRKDRFVPSGDTMRASEFALEAALSSDQAVDQADGLFGTGFMRMLRNDLDRGQDLMDKALELAARAGDRTLQARCLTYLTMLHRRSGQPNEVKKLGGEAREAAGSLGMQEYVAVIDTCDAWLALRNGDSSRATVLANQALETWSNKAPRYPFKWLALLPLIECSMKRDDPIGTVIDYLRELLSPFNCGYSGELEQKMQQAVTEFDAGNGDKAKIEVAKLLDEARRLSYV